MIQNLVKSCVLGWLLGLPGRHDFYIAKTKRRLHDRKTENFKAITSSSHVSAIADSRHVNWSVTTQNGTTLKYTLGNKGDSTNKGIETNTK